MDSFYRQFPSSSNSSIIIMPAISRYSKFLLYTEEKLSKYNFPEYTDWFENRGINASQFEEIEHLIANLKSNLKLISKSRSRINKIDSLGLGCRDSLLQFLINVNSDTVLRKKHFCYPTNFLVMALDTSFYTTRQTVLELNSLFDLLHRTVELVYRKAAHEQTHLNIPRHLCTSPHNSLFRMHHEAWQMNSLIQGIGFRSKLAVVMEDNEDFLGSLENLKRNLDEASSISSLAVAVSSFDLSSLSWIRSGRRFYSKAESNVFKSFSKKSYVCTSLPKSEESDSLVYTESTTTDESLRTDELLSISSKSLHHSTTHSPTLKPNKSVHFLEVVEASNKRTVNVQVSLRHQKDKTQYFNYLEPVTLKESEDHLKTARNSKLNITKAKTHIPLESFHALHSAQSKLLLCNTSRHSFLLKRYFNFSGSFLPEKATSTVHIKGSLIINISKPFKSDPEKLFRGISEECCKTATLQEVDPTSVKVTKSQISIPYSVSLNSLPLDDSDLRIIKQSLNSKFEYYINLARNAGYWGRAVNVYFIEFNCGKSGDNGSLKSNVFQRSFQISPKYTSQYRVGKISNVKSDSELSLATKVFLDTRVIASLHDSFKSNTGDSDILKELRNEKTAQFCRDFNNKSDCCLNPVKITANYASQSKNEDTFNVKSPIRDSLKMQALTDSGISTNPSNSNPTTLNLNKVLCTIKPHTSTSITTKNKENHTTRSRPHLKNSQSSIRGNSMQRITSEELPKLKNASEGACSKSSESSDIRSNTSVSSTVQNNFQKTSKKDSYATEVIFMHSTSSRNFNKVKRLQKTPNNLGKNHEEKNEAEEKKFQIHIPVKYFIDDPEATNEIQSRPSKTVVLFDERKRNCPMKPKQSICYFLSCCDKNQSVQESKRKFMERKTKNSKCTHMCPNLDKTDKTPKLLVIKPTNGSASPKSSTLPNYLLEKYAEDRKANKDEFNLLLKTKLKQADSLETSFLYYSDTKIVNIDLIENHHKLYNSDFFMQKLHLGESKQSLLSKMNQSGKSCDFELKQCKPTLNLPEGKNGDANVLCRSCNGTNISLSNNKAKVQTKTISSKSERWKGNFNTTQFKKDSRVGEALKRTVGSFHFSTRFLKQFTSRSQRIGFCLNCLCFNSTDVVDLNSDSSLRILSSENELNIMFDSKELFCHASNNRLLLPPAIKCEIFKTYCEHTMLRISDIVLKAFSSISRFPVTTTFNNSQLLVPINKNKSALCNLELIKFGVADSVECSLDHGDERVVTAKAVSGKNVKVKLAVGRYRPAKSQPLRPKIYWALAKINVNSNGIQSINIVEKLPNLPKYLIKKYT